MIRHNEPLPLSAVLLAYPLFVPSQHASSGEPSTDVAWILALSGTCIALAIASFLKRVHERSTDTGSKSAAGSVPPGYASRDATLRANEEALAAAAPRSNPPSILSAAACFDYCVVLARAAPGGDEEAGYRVPSERASFHGVARHAGLERHLDRPRLGHAPNVSLVDGVLALEAVDRPSRWARWLRRERRSRHVHVALGPGFQRLVEENDIVELALSASKTLTLVLLRANVAILRMAVELTPTAPSVGKFDPLKFVEWRPSTKAATRRGEAVREGGVEHRLVRRTVELAPAGTVERAVVCTALLGSGAEAVAEDCAREFALGFEESR